MTAPIAVETSGRTPRRSRPAPAFLSRAHPAREDVRRDEGSLDSTLALGTVVAFVLPWALLDSRRRNRFLAAP
jgi:hypothetical protein